MSIGRCILLLLWSVNTFAQQYHFTQYEISNELLRKNPTCLLRNQNNALYIGTKEGLMNFDGLNLALYLRKDNAKQHVTALYHDGSMLWVGYDDGAIYQLADFQLHPWKIKEGWPKSKITGIIRNKKGQYWISTYGEGIYIYADDVLYNVDTDDGLESKDIYSITSDKYGNIYAATDGGIFQCQFVNGKKIIRKLTVNPALDSDILQKLSYDHLRHVLYATSYENGIWQIDLQQKTAGKIQGITGNLKAFTQNHSKLICYSQDTKKATLFLHHNQTTEKMTAEGIDGDIDIIDLFLDEENRLWVLCQNNGLLSADASFITYISGMNQTQAILQVKDKIYIGNDKGLYETDKSGNSKLLLKDKNILSLFHSPYTDEIWIGTFGDGLYIIDREKGSQKHLRETNGLINDNIFSIISHKNDIWISTLAGIQQISQYGEFIKAWDKKTGLPSDYNYVLFSDSKQKLWVGSDGKGLVCFDDQHQFRILGEAETVISIAEDAKGRIWLCNLDKGLAYVENDKIIHFDEENGLTELHISGISSDAKGNILAYHHTGIDMIDATTLSVKCVGNHIGIRKWDQNINAFYKKKNHEHLLTHKDRWIVFDTKNHEIAQPTLVLKSVLCGQQYVLTDKANTFDHHQNDFQIEYIGIWMNDPKSVSYRYKMLPLDAEWRYTKDLKLIYPNLSPGTYKFYLQSSANLHFPNETTELVTFKIRAAFWQTWWFYTILGLVGLGAIFWWTEAKNKRAKMIQEMQTEQVKSQLETLKSQINPHFLFNSFNTLISAIEKEPKEAVIFVEKLADFYRSMLQYRDTDLITLSEELEIQENYRFLLFQRFRNNLSIRHNISDTNDYHIVPLTLQILIENAIKHNIVSANKPLEIHITRDGDYLKVKNNLQLRLTAEKSTHFGLQSLSKKYLTITGKEILVEQTEKYFCVTIPLIRI
jgi:ligand-binding sensor domain-containing protein/uncharacterized membrane-anchored protein YhcB (DUF1043 family)